MKRSMVSAVIVSLIMAALVVSCGGKKEVKKESVESKTATEAFAVAERIREAYIKNDRGVLERNTTKEGFRTILSSLKPFESAELEFSPVWVDIKEDTTVQLNISWKGRWQKRGKSTDERGMAVFIMKERPLKLDNILRANPFIYPE